jgi:hypothetical protein
VSVDPNKTANATANITANATSDTPIEGMLHMPVPRCAPATATALRPNLPHRIRRQQGRHPGVPR